MQFKDLSVEDLFKFARENSKIYKKINEFQCVRLLQEYPVFGDAEVVIATPNEEEDYEKIEKNSEFNRRLER